MIWTVTLNPAIETTYRVDELVVGAVHRSFDYQSMPSGKGMNVSSVLAQLELPSIATGILGGRNGEEYLDLVREVANPQFVMPRFVMTKSNTRRVANITDVHGGTVINEAGPQIPESVWDELIATLDVSDGDVVDISGSAPPNMSDTAFAAIIEHAKTRGAIVVVDISGPKLLATARAGADVFKPNDLELLAVTGQQTVQDGVAALQELGAGLVVVSLGADGVLAAFPHAEPVVLPACARIDGNPTGAGDSLVAGLVASIHEYGLDAARDQERLGQWLSFGQRLAAATVASPVAGRFDEATFAQLA